MRLVDRLNTLLHEETEVVFHGTTAEYVRTILKLGLVPNAKHPTYGREDDPRTHLAPFGGVYFSRSADIALLAGLEAVRARKASAEVAVVAARVEARTGLHDEDTFLSPYEAVGLVFRRVARQAPPGVWEGDFSTLDPWLYRYHRRLAVEAGGRILKHILRGRQFHAQLEQRARVLATDLVSAAIEEWRRQGYSMIGYRPNSRTRILLDALTRLLVGSNVARNRKALNLRLEDPVGFSGANRIMVEVRFPDQGPIELRMRYGSRSTPGVAAVRKAVRRQYGEAGVWVPSVTSSRVP